MLVSHVLIPVIQIVGVVLVNSPSKSSCRRYIRY